MMLINPKAVLRAGGPNQVSERPNFRIAELGQQARIARVEAVSARTVTGMVALIPGHTLSCAEGCVETEATDTATGSIRLFTSIFRALLFSCRPLWRRSAFAFAKPASGGIRSTKHSDQA
jgi:hypothetical protein